MNTQINVYFTLIGKFDPEVISRRLTLFPTKVWRAGDIINRTLLTYKDDGWQFSLGAINTLDMDACLSSLMDVIYPLRNELKCICDIYSIKSEIAVEIEITKNQRPIIHLMPDRIKQISEINSELDIDVY